VGTQVWWQDQDNKKEKQEGQEATILKKEAPINPLMYGASKTLIHYYNN
jgi:hypothetical protein